MNVKDKLGLLGATILTFGLGAVTPAIAQDAPEAAEEEDVIVVTGSRLRRETFDSPNPTFQVGTEQIDTRQISNTIDALEDIPLIGIGSNNRGANAQFGDNFAFPNVLSVGSQRTLSLLNGRRVVASNQGTVFVPGNASGAQVDLSMINPQIIDRVEVLTGTGGAIYGADAVAGVVNIITKDDYEGLDLRVQAGVTELGDGEQRRVSGLWGANFFDDRANLTVSADYFQQDLIVSSDENFARYLGTNLGINVLDAGTRNPAAFSAASAIATLTGGGALGTPFLPTANNQVSSSFFGPIPLNTPVASEGGVLLSRFLLNGGFSANTQLIPGTPQAAALAGFGLGPSGLPIFAPTTLGPMTAAQVFAAYGTVGTGGLTGPQQDALALQLLQRNQPTPYEYAVANPNLNPLLFVGKFGPGAFNGGYPTITNVDPATSGLFPRIAAPFQFDASGNLVPYNIGNIMPPLQGRFGSTFGNAGYDAGIGHLQIQAGSERFSFASTGHFDVTDYMRLRQELLYTHYTFESIGGAQANVSNGSSAAGTTAVPIYINQNPFLPASSVTTINNLVAQGWGAIPLIGGQPAVFMGRALTDLTGGGTHSENEVTTFRVAEIIEGDFNVLDRDFYWDVAGAYGRAESINRAQQLLDIEFALATDVVDGDPGPGVSPVCRQQTLPAPESIAIRNPGLATINTTLSLIPTAAQVAACVPLNLFGNGNASQAAIDYVSTDGGTENLNTQEYFAAALGGEILHLPAGAFSMGVQAEWRRESIAFEPGRAAAAGSARNTTIQPGSGILEFTEYGYEATLPIFGEAFNFPGAQLLELNYAFRIVERSQTSTSPFFPVSGDPTEDDTFTYSFRWQPVEDLTIRGSRSRSVRSASLVELFGPPSTGFGGWPTGTHPCTPGTITQGSAPATRTANCRAAVIALNVDPDGPGPLAPIGTLAPGVAQDTAVTTFLNTFTDVAVNRPAAAVGNPFLQNEEGNSYSYGITYQPSFVPRLTFAADFFSVDISGLVGLNGPTLTTDNCFDDPNFPNSSLNGTPSCDLFSFGVETAPSSGVYITPAINPLTGNPIGAGAVVGQPAQVQSPFEVAFITFPNLNIGVQQTRGINFEVRYNFGLDELPLIGDAVGNWGDIFLSTSAFQLARFDVFGDNVNLTDRLAKEHGTPEYRIQTNIRHRIGPFDQTLNWFWTSETVTNIQTPKAGAGGYPEQAQNFFAPDYHYFNYNASYEITDNMTMRLVVNNLTNTVDPRGQFGNINTFDGNVGREFIIGLNARF